jgi:hypothetical protein
MNLRAFLVSVVNDRIEKSTNVNFQYKILNLITLYSDSFQSKYIHSPTCHDTTQLAALLLLEASLDC